VEVLEDTFIPPDLADVSAAGRPDSWLRLERTVRFGGSLSFDSTGGITLRQIPVGLRGTPRTAHHADATGGGVELDVRQVLQP